MKSSKPDTRGQDAQCVNQGARWEALAVYTCGAAELACFALDHDQPPEAVSIRHRDALYAVAAPFDRVPELLARTVDTGASYGAGRARQARWAGARSSG